MTLDEAIKHAEEEAKEQDKLCKRYDDASGYSRSHNEAIRTTDAKRCEKCASEHRQLAEWLKDYKRLKEREPCEDAISRREAISIAGIATLSVNQVVTALKKLPSVNPQKPICPSAGIDCEDCPAYEPKTGWIPVSKRLPEKDKYADFYKCMVARLYTSRSNTCDICIAYFDGKRFLSHNSHGIVSGVKAWMPLPEPYKAEGSKE